MTKRVHIDVNETALIYETEDPKGAYIVSEEDFDNVFGIPVRFDPVEGNDCFVILARYNGGGDSFHDANRTYTEVVGVFDDADEAVDNCQRIHDLVKHGKRYGFSRSDFTLTNGDVCFPARWCGVFEFFQCVEVFRLTMLKYRPNIKGDRIFKPKNSRE